MKKSSCGSAALFLFFVFAFIFLSCSGSVETTRQETKKENLNEFLVRYEKTFNPSQYEIEVFQSKTATQESAGTRAAVISDSLATETVSGFRVQLMTTQEIDEATQLRDSLTLSIDEQWIYIVYDAPSYKVRIGNFTDRLSADKFVSLLLQKGFYNAWAVPDQILKNPPPKPKILPEQQPQKKHEH